MKVYRLVITVGLAVAIVFGLAPGLVAQTTYSEKYEYTCIVRLYVEGPQILENDHHICIGIDSVSKTAEGDLKLKFGNFAKVTSIEIEEDETLSPRGIQCGPSGGVGGSAIIKCGNGKHLPINKYPVACSLCNLWITVKGVT